jgi:voltage-gated potassium channel
MVKWGNVNIEDYIKVEKKIVALIMMAVFIGVLGTINFVVLEHQEIMDAIYSTLASGVGHSLQSPHPITVMMGFLIMIMEWVFLWTLFDTAIEFISEGKMRELMGGIKMRKKIEGMKNHCIICGFGRVGSEIAKNLHSCKHELVIVERDPHEVKEALDRGYIVMEGDVLNEETLKSAGVERARVLVAAMGSDADNVFISLTARGLNPKIKIVARAEREESVKKLKQAGAAEVVMPSAIGGKAMANAVTRS